MRVISRVMKKRVCKKYKTDAYSRHVVDVEETSIERVDLREFVEVESGLESASIVHDLVDFFKLREKKLDGQLESWQVQLVVDIRVG